MAYNNEMSFSSEARSVIEERQQAYEKDADKLLSKILQYFKACPYVKMLRVGYYDPDLFYIGKDVTSIQYMNVTVHILKAKIESLEGYKVTLSSCGKTMELEVSIEGQN